MHAAAVAKREAGTRALAIWGQAGGDAAEALAAADGIGGETGTAVKALVQQLASAALATEKADQNAAHDRARITYEERGDLASISVFDWVAMSEAQRAALTAQAECGPTGHPPESDPVVLYELSRLPDEALAATDLRLHQAALSAPDYRTLLGRIEDLRSGAEGRVVKTLSFDRAALRALDDDLRTLRLDFPATSDPDHAAQANTLLMRIRDAMAIFREAKGRPPNTAELRQLVSEESTALQGPVTDVVEASAGAGAGTVVIEEGKVSGGLQPGVVLAGGLDAERPTALAANGSDQLPEEGIGVPNEEDSGIDLANPEPSQNMEEFGHEDGFKASAKGENRSLLDDTKDVLRTIRENPDRIDPNDTLAALDWALPNFFLETLDLDEETFLEQATAAGLDPKRALLIHDLLNATPETAAAVGRRLIEEFPHAKFIKTVLGTNLKTVAAQRGREGVIDSTVNALVPLLSLVLDVDPEARRQIEAQAGLEIGLHIMGGSIPNFGPPVFGFEMALLAMARGRGRPHGGPSGHRRPNTGRVIKPVSPDIAKGKGFQANRRFFSEEEFAQMSGTGLVDPRRIRTSQRDFSEKFTTPIRIGSRKFGTVTELSNFLRSGKITAKQAQLAIRPPIKLVIWKGRVFTVDHRKFIAFRRVGFDIPYEIVQMKDLGIDHQVRIRGSSMNKHGEYILNNDLRVLE